MGSNSTAPQLRSHEFVVESQLVKNCEQFFLNNVSTFWNRLPRDNRDIRALNITSCGNPHHSYFILYY
ncbi:hypothetical protein BpHYR1_037957 [Brachionus plicatilis]|uniref:Uncharacterized protein n=1 Tax=Brachionus plicatilis TaxID=10195 RepID=A0A3M7QDD8_BRAPC|nr:hypothetical protein BpHYR1_037957 [Brachionus plicatilis]